MAHNEHYKIQDIDTLDLFKANKSLQSLVDVCEFNIDKYNRRRKFGEELKDTDKIIFYTKLKKEAISLSMVHGYHVSYNTAKRLNRKRNNQ